jgi:hypothetical protein
VPVVITWEAVLGICAVVGLICGANALYVQYAIRAAVDDLFVRLNGRYVRAELCIERHSEHSRRLAALEE